MIKQADLTKILKNIGAVDLQAPFLLGSNDYGQIYSSNSNLGKLIIKIGYKEYLKEKIPGLGSSRLLNECLFNTQLAHSQFIAEIIKFDDSEKIISHPYLIVRKISGDNLARLTEQKLISFTSLAAYYKEMGKKLKEIHRVKFNYFGNLSQRSNNNQPAGLEWGQFYGLILERCLDHIGTGTFAASQALLRKYVAMNLSLLNKIKITPTLVHGDFEAWNVIVKNNKLVGVIDSEFAFIGHNFLDLTPEYPVDLTERSQRTLQARFLHGYFENKKISPIENKILDFYRHTKMITHRLVAWEHFSQVADPAELKIELRKINQTIKEIKLIIND